MSNPLPSLAHRNDLPGLFNHLGLSGNGVEVGVSFGGFAVHLRSVWKGKMLYLVDRWIHVPEWQDSANVSPNKQEEYFYHVCRTFHPARNVDIRRMDSQAAAATFEDGFFDWIYIDADHSYKAVKSDLAAWYPKLKSSGILAGHDYMNGEAWGCLFEVRHAVDEWAQKENLLIQSTNEQVAASWYCQKP